jgi:CubicO group peptidase (beta-lactamase class C family)
MIERTAIIARGAKARQPGIGHWDVGVEAAVGRLQARLQDLADARVAAGAEVGLQIAVFHRGTLVADVAAGLADPASGRRAYGDTLFSPHRLP